MDQRLRSSLGGTHAGKLILNPESHSTGNVSGDDCVPNAGKSTLEPLSLLSQALLRFATRAREEDNTSEQDQPVEDYEPRPHRQRRGGKVVERQFKQNRNHQSWPSSEVPGAGDHDDDD